MTGQVGHDEDTRRFALSRVAVPAVAVLLAAVLLTALVMAAMRSGTASARTVLLEGVGVTAALADGTRRPLGPGDVVPPGATVTSDDGAVLRTRDRDVHLGPGTSVTVVDGARQELTAGRVMVDARRGPALVLGTEAAVVTTPDGALSRVEQRAVLRVGAFDGDDDADAVQVSPTGRRTSTELDRWTQTQVPVGGLAGRVTPLVLTGDSAERRLAAQLVADDRMLSDLERTLDAGGPTAAAVLTALESALPGAAPGPALLPVAAVPGALQAEVPAGEQALAYLLARAADGSAALGERYAQASALRADGGSWGPVARLVDAPVPAVSALLDELLAGVVLAGGQTTGPIDLAGLLAPTPPALTTVPGGPTAPGTGSGTPASGGGGPSPDDDDEDDDPPPSDPPPPGPTPPVPPPPSDPVGTVTEVVDTVVDTVIGLIPTPLPSPLPSPTPLPELPPLPSPTPSLPLLG